MICAGLSDVLYPGGMLGENSWIVCALLQLLYTCPRSRYTLRRERLHSLCWSIRPIRAIFAASEYASTKIPAAIQCFGLAKVYSVCTSNLVSHRVIVCAERNRVFSILTIIVIGVIVVVVSYHCTLRQRFQARRGVDVPVKSRVSKIHVSHFVWECCNFRVFSKIKFIRFIHVQYRLISLKNRQIELVISVTQIYGGKVIRREDGALPAQRKRQWKSARLTKISQHSSSFLNSRASTVYRNRRHICPQKLWSYVW